MKRIIITASVRFEEIPEALRPGYLAKVRRALTTLVRHPVLWRTIGIRTTVSVTEDKPQEKNHV